MLARVQDHIISSTNFNPFQSAYRKYNSTETAMILTLDNIFHSIDQGMYTILVSLDLSAAFDTVDHIILLNRFQSSFGIHGTALSRFHSYLSNRTQFVQIGNSRSSISSCPTGVPQDSVLGSMLFTLYTFPIAHIVSSFDLLQQQYTVDTQLYVAVSRLNQSIYILQLERCLSALHTWFSLNGLALNSSKSEVILMVTRQRSAYLPSPSNIIYLFILFEIQQTYLYTIT